MFKEESADLFSMPRKRQTADLLWRELSELAAIYPSPDSDDPSPWTFTIEPWTLTSTTEGPAVAVLWHDWPAGEVAPGYAEIFAPGFEDAARELRRHIHDHIHQYRRLGRIPTQELLIPYP